MINTPKLLANLKDKPVGVPLVPVSSFDELFQYFEIFQSLKIPCGMRFSLESVNRYEDVFHMIQLANELRDSFQTYTFFVYDASHDIETAMEMTGQPVEIIRYDGTHDVDYEYISGAKELARRAHLDGSRQLLEIEIGTWLDEKLDSPFHDIFGIVEAVDKIQPDVLGFQFVNVYKDFEFRGTKQLEVGYLEDLYTKVSRPMSFRGIEFLPDEFIREAQVLDAYLKFGVGISPSALRKILKRGGAMVYLDKDMELVARLAKKKYIRDPEAVTGSHLLEKTAEEIKVLLKQAGDILNVTQLTT
jgi:fructose/tagatose bisphosphate aldolase